MDNGLISRADAIDEAEEWIEAVYCGHDEQRERDAIKHVINGIKKLPSAQPEIVHCEECAYRKDNFMGDWCTCWCGWTSLDGYCHKGANKDERPYQQTG